MIGAADAYRQAVGAYNRALSARSGAQDEMVGGGEPDGLQGGTAPGSSFADMVQSSLNQAIQQQRGAETQAISAVSGRGDLTAVVTSVAEAEVALQAVVAVRDRVVEAYKDILRMPI
jgi:Flagellar hook-basal body protein